MEDHPLRSHETEASHQEGVLLGGGEEAKLFPAQKASRAGGELGRKLVPQWVDQGQGSNYSAGTGSLMFVNDHLCHQL